MKEDRVNRASPLFHLAAADSTNLAAKRFAEGGQRLPFAVLADSQSAGRGRRGRPFYSPGDSGLYFTYALASPADRSPGQITCAAAVAAVDAVMTCYGIRISIKWINDLLYRQKKIGGILTEQTGSRLFIGIGINLWTAGFPDDLKETAGSLLKARPSEDRRLILARTLMEALDRRLHDEPVETMREYRQSLFHLNRLILVRSGTLEGSWILTRNIDEFGRLVAETEDGTLHILEDGDVSLSGKDAL